MQLVWCGACAVSRWVLDVQVLYGVLDERRRARGLSWRQLALHLGISPNVFSRMKAGSAPDAATLGALLVWLGWAPELALIVRETVRGGAA